MLCAKVIRSSNLRWGVNLIMKSAKDLKERSWTRSSQHKGSLHRKEIVRNEGWGSDKYKEGC